MRLNAKARKKVKATAKVICGARQTVRQSGRQTTVVNVGQQCRPVKRRRRRRKPPNDPIGEAEAAMSQRMGRRVDLTTMRPEYQQLMHAHQNVQRMNIYAAPAAQPAAAPSHQTVYVYPPPPPGLSSEAAARMGRGAASGESTLAGGAAAEAAATRVSANRGASERQLRGRSVSPPGSPRGRSPTTPAPATPGLGAQLFGLVTRSSAKVAPYDE